MNASWLLPCTTSKRPLPKQTQVHLDSSKDQAYFYNVVKNFETNETTRIKLANSFYKIKCLSEDHRLKKFAARPEVIAFGKCPPEKGPGFAICEATLMNGNRCSSRCKFGKYCGRHKLN